jgi:serine/threonine protein kinase
MEELIGSLLKERYQIDTLLGRQTGRRTFLAIDTQTNNSVVIKLLLFGPDFTWEDLKLFEREAEVLKSLDHLAVPQYLDFFEVELERGKGFALVQSHIAAKSLQQWIQAGRTFSENDLEAIATDILKILEYLHARQPAVIHRDIKPSNVLLTDRTAHSPGQVYLIDFGSVQTAIRGGTQTVVGTYGYMPPEQFGGRTSAATDIYALGVTLIYLATGCHPDELPQQDLRLCFEERVNLSPRLVSWLQRATYPSLEKRFQSAQQAIDSLNNDPSVNISNTLRVGDLPSERQQQYPALTTEKPFDCKVEIKKGNNNDLKILIPFDYSRWWLVLTGIIFLVWNTWYLLIPGAKPLEVLWLPIMLFGVSVPMLVMVLFYLIGYTRLHITPSTIVLSYKLLGITLWKSRKFRIEHVAKIELSGADGRTSFWPQLNIWAGKRKINLNSGQLTRHETDWLSHELGDWLKVPIDRH